VTATFSSVQLVLNQQSSAPFSTVLAAYNAASDGNTILIRDNTMTSKPFEDALTIDKNIVINGGLTPGFSSNVSGKTVTNGPLRIKGGSLRVRNVVIR
jgi:hypothetical protein